MNYKTKSKRILSSWQRVYSRQSVICAMDRFVNAVDTMNDTILIPARLMDIACEDDQFSDIGYNNYYQCFQMINSIKTELLWGDGGGTGNEAQLEKSPSNRRRLSITSSIFSDSDADSDSVISESSTSSSSSSSSVSTTSSSASSVSSMLTPETIIRNLRHHLFGLSDALNRLAESAIALTCKYQEDISGRV